MAPVPVSLPQTIGDATALLTAAFTAEAAVGVKMDTITHDPGGTPLAFVTTLVDSGVEELDGRLWELDYTLEGKDTAAAGSPLTPKDAATFAAFDVTADEGLTAFGSNPAALMFRWTGVAMAGATDTLQVELTALIRSTSSKQVEWTMAITREGTPAQDASIDGVVCPLVWLKGPTATSAAFELSVSKIVSTRMMSSPPSIRPWICWA